MTLSALTANEYSWFEHHSARGRYYGNIVAFLGAQGISKRTAFLKDGLAKYDVSAMCFLWCRHLVQYILACYEEKNEKINRHTSYPNYLKQLTHLQPQPP